jgi:prophage regulatory protein
MDNIIRIAAVLALTGLSRVSVWRLVRLNQFPPPIELSANAIGWLESDVAGWRASRPRRTFRAGRRKRSRLTSPAKRRAPGKKTRRIPPPRRHAQRRSASPAERSRSVYRALNAKSRPPKRKPGEV